MKRILIGADFVSSPCNQKYFDEGKLKEIIDPELYALMTGADYKIYNLELPLANKDTPIVKWAGSMRCPTSTINGYKEMGVSLFATSNNHILDNKKEGLQSTYDTLNKAGIPYTGSGMSVEEAEKPYTFMLGDKKIGIFNCCEHEFSTAQEYGHGANVFDALYSLDAIEEFSKQVDYLIVLYHGGKECYRYPSPYLQRVCRRIADKGANLVICQHTHCVGCEEDYNGSKIVYGQGNTLFVLEGYGSNEYWDTNVLVTVDYDGKDFKVGYIPVNHTELGLELDKTGEIMANFNKRTEQIKQPGFIKENYVKFCNVEVNEYLPRIQELNELAMINYFECEPHRELIITALKDKTFEK